MSKTTTKDVEKWVKRVLKAHGYSTVEWPDGSSGILNAPKRLCGIVSDLTEGLAALAAGDSLPELVEPPKKGKAS
jgi:hypothetical protein